MICLERCERGEGPLALGVAGCWVVGVRAARAYARRFVPDPYAETSRHGEINHVANRAKDLSAVKRWPFMNINGTSMFRFASSPSNVGCARAMW